MSENVTLYFKVSELTVPSAEIYYMQKFYIWELINFYVPYLRINGKNVFINAGVPSDPKNLVKFWQEWDKRAKFIKYISMREIFTTLRFSYNEFLVGGE